MHRPTVSRLSHIASSPRLTSIRREVQWRSIRYMRSHWRRCTCPDSPSAISVFDLHAECPQLLSALLGFVVNSQVYCPHKFVQDWQNLCLVNLYKISFCTLPCTIVLFNHAPRPGFIINSDAFLFQLCFD